MVKQLFNMKQIDKEITKYGAVKSITLTMYKDQIEDWKQKGYFKHIRNELSIIHGLEFACIQNEDETCSYHFLCPTEAIANRIYTMLTKMCNYNDVKHLVECDNDTTPRNSLPIRNGIVTSCPLFS